MAFKTKGHLYVMQNQVRNRSPEHEALPLTTRPCIPCLPWVNGTLDPGPNGQRKWGRMLSEQGQLKWEWISPGATERKPLPSLPGC